MAQVQVINTPEGSSLFTIIDNVATVGVYTDPSEHPSVLKAAGLFISDVELVTGKRIPSVTGLSHQKSIIIAGTIGHCRLLDAMVLAGKLDVSPIKKQWERYVIKTVEKPFPGVDKALVIAGSDHRGTAYGLLSISEAIGVSPWYWWADVPVVKKEALYVKPVSYISEPPSVKYRGIFINDEDWGLHPWAAKNFEKELGDIGPKTYAKVCELLLRLKANMLAPAMHSCSGAFYSHSESKAVADEYGILITTSHCEPLLFNNNAKSEWDTQKDGEWNYATNKDAILKKLDDRVKEAHVFDNIYTVGMRGLHDEGMRGNLPKAGQVKILQQAIAGQREVLRKYIQKDIESIPQIFVPYKEALDLYNLGLEVPDDVTLVWTDDNYGYIKRLSNPQEQKRKGGSGVYYHTSYLGPPHDNLWLCTTPPVLMYEELTKAYKTGADRYWLLNVGDIKPAEMGMQTFFDLAWNIHKFNIQTINQHQSNFLANIFGEKYKPQFQDILDNYYRLAWSRKPEFMGWEREWDTRSLADIMDTEFSFEHYNDARQRLSDYQRISTLSDKILQELPEHQKPAFFEMLGYPVKGSYQMNRKFLMAQLNHEKLREKDLPAANWAAEQSKLAYDSINSLTHAYNTMLDGKWAGMMAIAPGLVAKYQNMPKVTVSEGVGSRAVDLAPDGAQAKLDGCTVLNLASYKNKVSTKGHQLKMVEGVGYDWKVIQLGDATDAMADPKKLTGPRFEYNLPKINADSVTVYVYSLPFFPLYKGKTPGFGISVDGQPAYVATNEPAEFSKAWKDQVLQNGTVAVARFAVRKEKTTHTLSLICGTPGAMIQRVVVDWGGLQKTYVGPAPK